MAFLKFLSCFAVICSVTVISDVVRARTLPLPDDAQTEERKLYEQAEKYFKTIQGVYDATNFLNDSSVNRIEDDIIEVGELYIGAAWDRIKKTTDALSDVAKDDSLPDKYFKESRKMIREKLSKIQPFVSTPNKKEEVLKQLRDQIRTSLHSIEQYISKAAKEKQEKELQAFKKLLEHVKKNIDYPEKEMENLDKFIANHLNNILGGIEEGIKSYKKTG